MDGSGGSWRDLLAYLGASVTACGLLAVLLGLVAPVVSGPLDRLASTGFAGSLIVFVLAVAAMVVAPLWLLWWCAERLLRALKQNK